VRELLRDLHGSCSTRTFSRCPLCLCVLQPVLRCTAELLAIDQAGRPGATQPTKFAFCHDRRGHSKGAGTDVDPGVRQI
jgi:hypothetical protein